MTTVEPRWRRASGTILFCAGLWVWLRVSLESLPYTYHDLHYLFSLDGGYGPVEWVHPLFVPALGALRGALTCYDRILELAPPSGDVRADTLAARAHALNSLGRSEQARRSRLLALKAASPSWPWRKDLESLVH